MVAHKGVGMTQSKAWLEIQPVDSSQKDSDQT